MPEISVIVPAYNVESYLAQCLDSILRQTFTDFEVIVVDDGSADASGKIADAYAESDVRVHVLHQKNRGLVAARQTGVRKAAGRFITYVDGDDWLEADALATLQEAMQDGDLAIAAHYEDFPGLSRYVAAGLQPGQYERQEIKSEIMPRLFRDSIRESWQVFPYAWGKLFLREKLLSLQLQVPLTVTVGEDAAVTWPYICHSDKISIVKKAIYHYRQRPGSMTDSLQHGRRLLQSTRVLYEYLRTMGMHSYAKNKLSICLLDNILLPSCYFIWPETVSKGRIFLFGKIPQGSSLVIYGAGKLGSTLKCKAEAAEYRVCAWLDRDAALYREWQMDVQPPEYIKNLEFENVLVAVLNKTAQEAIRQRLADLGIEYGKIKLPDLAEAKRLEKYL